MSNARLTGAHRCPSLGLTASKASIGWNWRRCIAQPRLATRAPPGWRSSSPTVCLAREDERLVGAGRALADGADCSYICDIAVLPSHQGTGVGKEIVSRLVALSKGHKKVILYAVPGKESFYRRFGFRRMLTAMAIFENQAQALESGYVSET